MTAVIIILTILVLVGATVGILFATGTIKVHHNKENTAQDEQDSLPARIKPPTPDCAPDGSNTIAPQPFKVGYVADPRHITANNCSNKPGPSYSIQQPYVKYGGEKMPKDCLCTEFVQAP